MIEWSLCCPRVVSKTGVPSGARQKARHPVKFLSDRMTSASGSIGGTTFSHNRGGLYTRARRKPVNPQTSFQNGVRNTLGALQAMYPTLSAVARNAWYVYSENMTFPNALGLQINYSAQNCYVMLNSPRIQGGLSRIDVAPTIFELATLTPPVPTITAGGSTVSVAYTNTDGWANEVGGALLVYASKPQNITINFFDGPYRFAGKVSGAATPPTSPAVITLPFVTGPTGSKQMFKFVAVRADGRISSAFRVTASI